MVLRNLFSMTGLNVVKAVSSLLVSTMMAGLVPPEKYGLIAFAIPLMAFITLLTDLGLTSAIVRHPDLNPEQAGAAVGVLGIAGLAGGTMLAALARPLERALSLEGLTPVLIGFSLVTAFSIWATAPRALLERQLSYPKIALVEAVALGIALSVFTIGVRMSAGILSLVAFHIVLQGTRASAFSALSYRYFVLNLRFARISALARVGGWVFISNLLAYLARNVDRMMIGSFLGAASLGLYSFGYQFMTIPLVLVTWPVSGVLLSTLARIGDDRARKVDVTCAIITGTVAISFPLMTFLMFGARFPVDHYLSEHWHNAIDVITVLAPVGAVQSVAAYNGAILVERGAVHLNFKLALLSSASLSGIFVLAVWAGLPALLRAYAAVSMTISLVMVYYMCREAGISLRRFCSCLVPGTTAAMAATLAVAIMSGLTFPSFYRWLSASLVYASVTLLVFVLDRGRLRACLRALGGTVQPAMQTVAALEVR